MSRKHHNRDDEFVDIDLEANTHDHHHHHYKPSSSKPKLPRHSQPIKLTTLPNPHKSSHSHSPSHDRNPNTRPKSILKNTSYQTPSPPSPQPKWISPLSLPPVPPLHTRLLHALRPRFTPSTALSLAPLTLLIGISLLTIIMGGLLVKWAGTPMPGEAILWISCMVGMKVWVGAWFLVRRLRGEEGEDGAGIEEVSWEEVVGMQRGRRERVERVGAWKKRAGRRKGSKLDESSKVQKQERGGDGDAEEVSRHVQWASDVHSN